MGIPLLFLEGKYAKKVSEIKGSIEVLIGKTASTRHIPVEEIEEKAETR